MSTNNWRASINMEDYLRHHEKRLMHEERRPRIASASDLLGPGAAPYAVRLVDWNSNEAVFVGVFYSDPGALNSPDRSLAWMGETFGTQDGRGVQHLWELGGEQSPIPEYTRGFTPLGGGRVYTDWVLSGPAFVIVEHGTNAAIDRPVAITVHWVGTADPVNKIDTDFWTQVNL